MAEVNEHKRLCPECGAEMMVFFPNISWLSQWHCTSCDHAEAASDEDIERELELRAKRRGDDEY